MDLPAPIIGKKDYKPVLQMVVGPPLGWACIGQTAYFGAREEQREIFSYDLHFSLLRSHCVCNFRCQGGSNVCNSSGRPAGPPPPSLLIFPCLISCRLGSSGRNQLEEEAIITLLGYRLPSGAQLRGRVRKHPYLFREHPPLARLAGSRPLSALSVEVFQL